ncbi:hypothetical protein HY086_01495 [Candidatus Gottesmanbacteria bacterium]|nr:hypothetical protein [Candidatus Gottesmanbacteria bacterium]
MNLKVLSAITLASVVTLSTVTPVFARGPKFFGGELSERSEGAGSRPGLLKKTFDLRGKAAIGSGTVTAKSGTTLTVSSGGKTFTVLTDDKTQFRFRFWGKGSLAAIQVGDTVNVIGKWQDDAHTTVLARLVRDISLQRRFGAFIGAVKSLLPSGWVMTTVSGNRPDQTVTISSSTKFVNRNEETITKADIVVGHRVRVKGLWDSAVNTITEVKAVKDFSLPPKPTPTP